MSNNTKIFSEAIAEAKAIRETAMANAKLALEEAFAPRIQEMMSDKLEALAEEDVNEDYGQAAADAAMDVANEEISLEELLAELDGLEEGHAEPDADNKGGKSDNDADNKMEENTIAEAEDDDEVGTISVDELKDIIRDIMADVMGGGEEEEAGEEEVEAGEEEMEAGEDDLELEEILAEIANLEEGDEEEMEEGIGSAIKGGLEKFDKWIGDTSQKLDKAGQNSKLVQKIEKGVDSAQKAKERVLGKSPLGRGHSISETDELDEWGNGMAAGNFKGDDEGDIARWVKAAAKKTGKSAEEIYDKISYAIFGGEKMPRYEAEELQEAMSTIATLRSELNEVNLLNAKLLYVNKLFKAKNLNEAQKVKVINAFDRAETVREAKNVFDTLNESLNTEKAKSQIKESLSFASKASGVSDRQPIMEGNDFVNRMQKLAGII